MNFKVVGDKTIVSRNCKMTGEPYSVTVLTKELNTWRFKGKLIQDAMPNTSADDREFLISGYSPKGWEMLFPKEESDV